MSRSTSDTWQNCPPGELQRVLETVKIRQRRMAKMKLAGTGTAIAAFGVAGYAAIGWVHSPLESRPGPLACNEVAELMADYRAKRLSVDLSHKVAIHLRECPNCAPKFRHAVDS